MIGLGKVDNEFDWLNSYSGLMWYHGVGTDVMSGKSVMSEM